LHRIPGFLHIFKNSLEFLPHKNYRFSGSAPQHLLEKITFLYLVSDDYNDAITLQQTNSQLAEELQESRDRLYQIQKDRKIETKELADKNNTLTEDLKRSRAEVQKHRDEIAKMRKTVQEAAERERDLKAALEALEAARRQNRELKQKVEEEQELSFKISIRQKKDHDEMKQQRLTAATNLAMHKENSIQSEAQLIRQLINYRQEQAGRAVRYLLSLNLSPVAAGRLSGELDEYVAQLHAARDELDQLAAEQCRRVAEPDFLPSLDFDLKRVELPPVSSGDLTLLLLSLTAPAPAQSPPVMFGPPHLPHPLARPPMAAHPPFLMQPPPGMPAAAQFLPRAPRPHSGKYRYRKSEHF
jgi:uncharacterized protein YoxC